MKMLRLALLAGGASSEREVSLASGREVLANLDPGRYETRVYDPAMDLARLVADAPGLDVAFPALHGRLGEDGSVQGLLELLGLPYVGSGIFASALAMDKRASKEFYRLRGLPVAPDGYAERSRAPGVAVSEAARLAAGLGLPLVVKPLDHGSSVGMAIVRSAEELAAALESAWECSTVAMAERFLAGREYTVAVMGNREPAAMPPVEIIPGPGHPFFDYSAKYSEGECREICPCDLDPEEDREVRRLAVLAHRALGCRGFSRTDFILAGGIFHVLETNTLPGLTAQSLLPKAVRAHGLSFPEFLDRLVELALEPD
ncbi:MAG: D-alanine--D-alanine ligase [Deltaproteobacteria bacterium]|jgi:D-alanine-D-alanine ligase|nr:D-alanine--D-alanine ligase [Deltaproteobacteria bacterium]